MKTFPNEIKLNILGGLFYQFSVLLTNYFTKQALFHCFGAEYAGLQATFASICDILVLAYSGIGSAMLFMLYKPVAENDVQKQSDIYFFFNRASLILTFLTGGVGVLITAPILFLIRSTLDAWLVAFYYLLYLLSILIFDRFVVNFYFFMANQKRFIGSVIYGTIDIIALAVELLTIYFLKQYELFLLVIILKNTIEGLTTRILAKRFYPPLRHKSGDLLPQEKKKAFRDMKHLIVSKIGDLLIFNTDNILISNLLSAALAGIYSSYNFVVLGIENTINDLFETFMARIGKLNTSASNQEKFKNHMQISVINVVLTAVCVSGYCLMAENFITLWIGEDAVLGKYVLIWTGIEMYLQIQRRSVFVCRQTEGLFKELSGMILFRGIFNIILSIVLGLIFGLPGILSATVISDGLTVCWYEPYVLYKKYQQGFGFGFLYQAVSILVTVYTILLNHFLIQQLSDSGWLAFVLKILVILVTSVLINLPFVGISEFAIHHWKKKDAVR